MRRSIELGPGIYQFEFTEDNIAVAKWDAAPESTLQWVRVEYGRFYLEGNSLDDIRVVPVQ